MDVRLPCSFLMAVAARNGLALVFEAQQKFSEAEGMFRRALEGNVFHYGRWVPLCESKGRLYQQKGVYAEIVLMYEVGGFPPVVARFAIFHSQEIYIYIDKVVLCCGWLPRNPF